MAKTVPKKQHYVPGCYLREWADPTTPPKEEPYIWIFERGSRKGRRKAPSNIFKETDLYTLHQKSGAKDYIIEEALSKLEARYAALFRARISNYLPLTADEHIVLCSFVGAMLQRTLRHRDMLARFFDQLIEHTEAIEEAHETEPRESIRLRELKQNAHKLGLITLLPDLTRLLSKMSVAFLCAQGGSRFVTSDDPCNLFNPDLQWQRFVGPGLAQKNIQVTLPLSPKIMLCMSWSALRGYMWWSTAQVHEANRMVVGHCYQYFISDSRHTRRHWFRRYPLDLFFILRILGHKLASAWHRITQWIKYPHVRK